MTDPRDPMTMAERYSAAIGTSHLEVKERRSDVDLIVAAGWTHRDGGGLGVALYRLRTEWDAAAGEYRMAQRHLREAEIGVKRAARLPAENKAKRIEAFEAHRLAAGNALTAKALCMVQLKTLYGAKQALGAFAITFATRQRYMRDDAHVLAVAGRTLSAWLDSQCQACRGRGFSGGWNAPMVLCTACGSTGDTLTSTGGNRLFLSPSSAGHEFGRALLVRMDATCNYVERQMKRYLRQHGPAAETTEDAKAKLRARLQELRSTEAETD